MIRIIFDNGEVADCEHISKIYIEEYEEDKITIVGSLKPPCETCAFSDLASDDEPCEKCDDRSFKEVKELYDKVKEKSK